MRSRPESWLLVGALQASLGIACAGASRARSPQQPEPGVAGELSCPAPAVTLREARVLIDRYCVNCHSPSGAAGPDYDFRSDAALLARRRNVEAKLRLGAMPPPGFKQPPAADREALLCWARSVAKAGA